MSPPSPTILLLPGWQTSGPGHGQSLWEMTHGDRRVEQHDWMRPLRGDWSARLEEEVLAVPGPVLLAAHSLGCVLVAAWAAHSQNTQKVAGALLVAPGDVEREDLRELIPGWAPVVRQRLPFASTLVGATNDPYCSAGRAQGLAQDWGARYVGIGPRGHINAESGLGDWPEGRAWLLELRKGKEH